MLYVDEIGIGYGQLYWDRYLLNRQRDKPEPKVVNCGFVVWKLATCRCMFI